MPAIKTHTVRVSRLPVRKSRFRFAFDSLLFHLPPKSTRLPFLRFFICFVCLLAFGDAICNCKKHTRAL